MTDFITHGTRKLRYHSNLIKFIFSNYSIQMVPLFHFFLLILRIFWTSRFKSSRCAISKRPSRLKCSLLNRVPLCQIVLLTYMCCSSQIIQARKIKTMSTPQLKWSHQFTTGKYINMSVAVNCCYSK